MKNTAILWMCLAALVASNCKPAHTAERLDNAAIAAQYSAALSKCVDDAVATAQTTHDHDKAAAEYAACAHAADVKFGRK
jgi:hypothetical protein